MQESSPLITLSTSSPSFNSYSSGSGKYAEIAKRVVQELAADSERRHDATPELVFDGNRPESNHHFPVDVQEGASTDRVGDRNDNTPGTKDEDGEGEEEEGEFEFAVSCSDMDSFSITAEDVFYNGQIRPVYPLFNTNLLSNQEPTPSTKSDHAVATQPFKPKRSPLRKLFHEENESQNSCSSSEADELEGLAPETYCVWTPKKEVRSGCKKSSSTGSSSSKRWKFRDLLYNRSSSDGKDTFVFLTPSKIKGNMINDQEGITRHSNKVKGIKEVKPGGFEELYLRNRAIKEGDKRRSFLPYRQDLVGFLSNVHGVSRNLGPF